MSPQDRLQDIVQNVLAMSAEEWLAAKRTDWGEPLQETRLMEIAMQAVRDNPRDWDGAKDALYRAVRNDAGLLWALFEPYRLQAVHKKLTEAAAALRQQERETIDLRLKEAARSGHSRFDNHGEHARSAGSREAATNARAAVVQLTLLDTFKINGRPIGDCTPREANDWAASRERDARFVRLLTANLPESEPIRKYIRPEEVQHVYTMAEKENV